MKKAKVRNGMIQHVWPYEKTLEDGTIVRKELPPQYQGLNEKGVPDCIVEVPDEVEPGWSWNETLQCYAPIIKRIKPVPRSDMIEIFAEKLGIDYDELFAAITQRKKDKLAQIKVEKAQLEADVNVQLQTKLDAGEALSIASVREVVDVARATSENSKVDNIGDGAVNLRVDK
jgi:hypothetical protein